LLRYTGLRLRRSAVKIAKAQLVKLVNELPETVDIEEVLYRLALRERLEAAEEDVREGRLLSEAEVEAEIARWFAA
jgi:hypothetical protein